MACLKPPLLEDDLQVRLDPRRGQILRSSSSQLEGKGGEIVQAVVEEDVIGCLDFLYPFLNIEMSGSFSLSDNTLYLVSATS